MYIELKGFRYASTRTNFSFRTATFLRGIFFSWSPKQLQCRENQATENTPDLARNRCCYRFSVKGTQDLSVKNWMMPPSKIYITSLARSQPGKRPLTAIAMPYTCTPLETKPTMSMAMDSTTNQPRKRQRLTHLSPDEKLMRRYVLLLLLS